MKSRLILLCILINGVCAWPGKRLGNTQLTHIETSEQLIAASNGRVGVGTRIRQGVGAVGKVIGKGAQKTGNFLFNAIVSTPESMNMLFM